MSRYEVTVHIQAPVPQVWAAFMDPANMPHWMTGFLSIENLSGEAEEVGSRWRMMFEENGREIVLDETVTGVRKGEEFSFRIDHDTMWSESTIRFQDEGGGTRMVSSTEAAGKGLLGRAMMGLMSGHMKKRQFSDFERFKELVEKGQARTAAG